MILEISEHQDVIIFRLRKKKKSVTMLFGDCSHIIEDKIGFSIYQNNSRILLVYYDQIDEFDDKTRKYSIPGELMKSVRKIKSDIIQTEIKKQLGDIHNA